MIDPSIVAALGAGLFVLVAAVTWRRHSPRFSRDEASRAAGQLVDHGERLAAVEASTAEAHARLDVAHHRIERVAKALSVDLTHHTDGGNSK